MRLSPRDPRCHRVADFVAKGPACLRRFLPGALALAFVLFVAATSRAAGVVPPPTELSTTLSLDDSLRMLRARGLDLLIAEAATRFAEGAVKVAGAVPNPVVSATVGNGFTYSKNAYSKANCLANGADCSPWIYSVGISDSAAIEDSLSGKRELRLKVARNALAAAKLSRADAERSLTFQAKAAYVQVAQAALSFRFAKEVASANATTLRKFQDRYKGGTINEGDLQRIETQELEAEQAVDNAAYTLRVARISLAFLVGVRGEVPDFDVDTSVLDFSVPTVLRDATTVGLLRMAFDHRPDLMSLGYMRAAAEAQLELIKRQRIPDVTVGMNYAWGGFGGTSTNGPLQAPTLTFGVSAPLPIFYQLDGELRQASAQADASSLQQAKLTAQVVGDVSNGFAAVVATKALVERMEGPRRERGGLLASAKGAFGVIALQYEKGSANLTDYLDALRTYIAAKNEYFNDLASYRTALYQLESAIGTELR